MILNYIKDSKFIICLFGDIVINWVHYMDPFKLLIVDDEQYQIYKSRDCYFLYCKSDYKYLLELISNNKQNYYHWVITDFAEVDTLLSILDEINTIDYSIVNAMGETIFEDSPRKLNELKNYKHYFSCGDILKKVSDGLNVISDINNSDRMIIDYRYALIYFYVKCGYVYLNRDITITNNKKIGLFTYGKLTGRTWRNNFIDEIKDSNRLYLKSFSDEENFWFNMNNVSLHNISIIDYNEYAFNLIFETQMPFDDGNVHANFITEKTLKSLITGTSCYVLLQNQTYSFLTSCGFYFLNQEFGDYNLENYKKFCKFINESSDEVLLDFYNNTSLKSKNNKTLLYDYLYSYKEKEINLLINE